MLQCTAYLPRSNHSLIALIAGIAGCDLFDWLGSDFSRRQPKIRAETGENTLNIC